MATSRTQRPADRARRPARQSASVEHAKVLGSRRQPDIPEATVARLPVYLRALSALNERGVDTVSSEELAGAAGVNSAKLRKDLSYLGSYGTRGVGYEVTYLIYQISRELGLTQAWAIAIIGVGNLGHALANYGGFVSRGFRVAALFDADPALVGKEIAGITVHPMSDLESVVNDERVAIAVVATPAAVAQDVCDRLVAIGVTSVLNFAPVVLSVPDDVEVRKVDLSIELQILAFHEQRKAATGGGFDAGPDAFDLLVPARQGVNGGEYLTRPEAPGDLGDYPEVMPA